MAGPIDYGVQVPSILPALQMVSQGFDELRQHRAEAAKQNLAKTIGAQIASGDLPGAANVALQSGELGTGLDIQKMADEEKHRTIETVGRAAAMADTPEKWAAVTRVLAPKFGGQKFLDEYGNFNGGRDALIAESMDLKDQIALKKANEPKPLPSSVQEFQYAQTHPGFAEYQAKQAGLKKSSGAPPGFQVTEDGKQTFIPGGPHDPDVIAKEAKARNSAQDTGGDAGTIAQAIIDGHQPPILTSLYRLGGPVRAKLEEQGYDLTKAKQDWDATTKLLSTMNGATQTRLRQATMFVNESLGLVDELAQKWRAGNYPLFNKITLKAALEGIAGPEAQSLARQLSQQVTDIQRELAVVYKGGNSPTDMGLKQASEMINVNDPMQTVLDATNLIRRNMKYRTASLKLATAGVNDSQYNQMDSGQAPDATGTSSDLIAAPASGADTFFNDEKEVPEGATVKDDQGKLLIKRGGKLVPVQ